MSRRCIRCPQPAVPGSSRCRDHTTSNWHRSKRPYTEIYRSPAWTTMRARVLREEPMCCVEGCQARSTSVDHIVGLAEGGLPYERSNLRGMCHEHHKRRSSQQGGEARRKKSQKPMTPESREMKG